MHDIKLIRDNPQAFETALGRRGLSGQTARLLALDEERRRLLTESQKKQAERNALSKEIGVLKSKGQDTADIMARVSALRDAVHALDEQERALAADLDALLAGIPNTLADDVPDGKDETANRVVRTVGTPTTFSFAPKPHEELGESLGLMDFERAAKVAGARFVFLLGALARLERAVAQFMLDVHAREFGYTETLPPYLVNDQTMFGTGQLPKFADDQFKTTHGYWLIPTAEVVVTNIFAGEIIDSEKLPYRFVTYSPCFRAEAGAAGKDTKGMLRQHQFTKVELVSITHPDQSWDEHERMTACAEEILKRLALPYRAMLLCTGDTGFASKKTYDLEVWLPGQQRYREISSCSNTGDFQARRMNTRCRARGEKDTRFVHTLNGSGLAVGRTLIAIMENYQTADGNIRVPDVLVPYMGGLAEIRKAG